MSINPLFEDREVAVDKTVQGNQIKGRVFADAGIALTGAVDVRQPDPGPMVEKRYGANLGDRYGVGQWPNGVMRLYAAGAYAPATVNLSIVRGANQFDDVVTVYNNRDVAINTNTLNVGDPGNDAWRSLNLRNNRGFWHFSGPRGPENDDLAVFYKPNAGNYSERLRINRNGGVIARDRLCIDNECITSADLQRIKAASTKR